LSTVTIPFPSGDRHTFIVHSLRCEVGSATAVVVKDAGDDPDVTHGAHLTVTVAWRSDGEVVLHGGEGVGMVTRAGLGLPLGQPAINPVPRQMITDAVLEASGGRGVDVTISVPAGWVLRAGSPSWALPGSSARSRLPRGGLRSSRRWR
jgi:cobalt-precorrin-5B (C1)-methyltransferase